MKKISIKIRTRNRDLLPFYASPGAAGADLRADITEELIIAAHTSRLVPTGIFLEIPEGYEVQIRPRSGLALKHQVTVLNAPGTIDSDYRGEIQVILINHGQSDFTVTPGMRIAQMITCPVVQAEFLETEGELATSTRGTSGFGGTGLH